MKDPKQHNKQENKETTSFDHLKTVNPFIVPDTYFNNLNNDVMSRIKATENREHKSFSVRRLWLPVSSAAAILAICALLFSLLIPDNERSNASGEIELSYATAIEQYLREDGDLEEESIVTAMLADESDSKVTVEDLIQPIGNDSIPGKKQQDNPIILDTTISNEDILQYLIDEGFDIDPNS